MSVELDKNVPLKVQEILGDFSSGKDLVDWKNPPALSNLKQDYQDARLYHDAQCNLIQNWLDNLYVKGAAKITAPKGSSRIAPKLIRKQAEWRYGSLTEPFLSTDSIFNVYPITWEDREAAIQNQLVLNYQFNTHINKVKFIDDYIRVAVNEGTVIVRVGWDFQSEEVEELEPIIEFVPNPQMQPIYEELAALQGENPTEFMTNVPEELKLGLETSQKMGVLVEPKVTGQKVVKKEKVIKNAPTLEICDFRHIIIDPTCKGEIDKCNFIIYSFEANKAQLEKDGKYTNLDKIRVDNNSILGEPDRYSEVGAKSFNFVDEPRKKFVVYEYWGFWDIDGTGLVKPIVAAWVGDVFIRLEENPYPDKKLPFVIVPFMPKKHNIYGEPDGELLEENQKIIGALTRGMIDIVGKSANGQTGIRKDALDVVNKRKFEQGGDYEFNAHVDPRQAIHMHVFPEIPQSAQMLLQMQNMDAESITGVKSFSNGMSGNSLGDVATAVRGALDAASKRELGILRRLSQGITQIGRKFISMNAEFLSEEEVIRITNSEFIKVRRDDLQGNFDINLSISTAEEDNNKAQELAFMLQTMGNTMPPEMSYMVLADIAELRKMPDLAKRIKNFKPEPDPMAQQKMQLEMELLKAQIAKEQAMAAHYQSNAQFHEARIGESQAKARNLKSESDLKNQEYLMNEGRDSQGEQLALEDRKAMHREMEQKRELESKEKIARAKNSSDHMKEYLKGLQAQKQKLSNQNK